MKTRKEFYLREKLKAIKEELGDAPNGEDEVERFSSMIKDNTLSTECKRQVN